MTDFIDTDALDELDDFDSDDLEDFEDADDDYLNGMWSNHSFGRQGGEIAKNLQVAHGMVQSFVNAFARDGHYIVAFDEDIETAGTDLKAKHVVITPAPVVDPSLTPEQTGKILTGLAVHEISHPRYGRNTAQAVEKVFPGNRVADRLSNLLDDIRIEKRFVADYPGYAGVFAPTLDYVGNSAVKKMGRKIIPSMTALVDLAIAATRYPTFADWSPITSAEAAWWTDWAERGAREDSPKRHAEFIREALAHIAATKQQADKPKQTKEQGPSKKQDGDPSEGSGAGEQADDAEPTEGDEPGTGDETPAPQKSDAEAVAKAAEEMSDEEVQAATRNDVSEVHGELSAESGTTAVRAASIDNGADRREVRDLEDEAQQILDTARNIEDGVDVARSLKGLTSGRSHAGPSMQAVRYISNAILRSRTGNTAVTQHQKRGRLDSHALARTAYGDTRIFELRKAPSPGKYLVWVMVDTSGSMDWQMDAACQVAHSMAVATVGTPSVRMGVWAWSSPFRNSYAYAGVANVWESGQDPDQIWRMKGLNKGGTPDSAVMRWATKAIKRVARSDETPVILFVSDGAGDSDMNTAVEAARLAGVQTYSISFGRGFTGREQEARFGKGNYVPFQGTITETARPMAELFARITSRKENR